MRCDRLPRTWRVPPQGMLAKVARTEIVSVLPAQGATQSRSHFALFESSLRALSCFAMDRGIEKVSHRAGSFAPRSMRRRGRPSNMPVFARKPPVEMQLLRVDCRKGMWIPTRPSKSPNRPLAGHFSEESGRKQSDMVMDAQNWGFKKCTRCAPRSQIRSKMGDRNLQCL